MTFIASYYNICAPNLLNNFYSTNQGRRLRGFIVICDHRQEVPLGGGDREALGAQGKKHADGGAAHDV